MGNLNVLSEHDIVGQVKGGVGIHGELEEWCLVEDTALLMEHGNLSIVIVQKHLFLEHCSSDEKQGLVW